MNYGVLASCGLIFIGLILFVDELWVFGIPFGHILPDLSALDPTNSDYIRHWMLGIFLMILGIFLIGRYQFYEE